MHLGARRVAGNQQPYLFINAQHGIRAQWQMRFANPAAAGLGSKQGKSAARIARPILVYHFPTFAMEYAVSKTLQRCTWASRTPLETLYHDHEWGVPQHDDRVLFEFLVLEGAQAGLSWSTILAKRENYREALDGFDPARIARYTDARIEKLMLNAGIVRNRLKLLSCRTNARAFLAVQKEFGSFDAYLWKFVRGKPIDNRFRQAGEVPARTELSDRISKDLLKRGFKFVGSTIIYAYMQAVGLVNDHLPGCWPQRKSAGEPS